MNFGEVSAKLRKPFPREQVGKLPATQKRPALDFVGHAAVTDRLNDVCPDDWFYTVDEMFNVSTEDGIVCWIRGTFTVCGISRVEYGDGKDPKDAIGNFIRRGAMRFGVAIDLWSRQELSGPVEPAATGAGGVAGTDGALAYGEGASAPDVEAGVGAQASTRSGGGASADVPPAPDRALSSQTRELLRLATEIRWDETEVAQALEEAFPDTTMKTLTQTQARELIPVWASIAKSVRMTSEQVDEVKTLATLKDARQVAERLFGMKVTSLHVLTKDEGTQLIEALRGAA